MKKIVIISDVWYPQVNGVLTVLEKTMEILQKQGWSVTVIHPGLFHTIPMPFYSEIRTPLFSRKKIEETIMKENPDHIHIVTEGLLGLNARNICKKSNLKFTTAYHTHFAQYLKIRAGIFGTLLTNVAYAYLRWFHNGSSMTIVSTLDLKNELQKNNFTDLAICPLGVDTDFFIRNEETANDLKKPVFFYLGRVADEKNIDEFLRCDLPGTKLVIGDGPERKKYEIKYKGKAYFLGYKKGKELVDLISMCDVMVFPSRTDTFGLTIIEAMSCGVPVAAHNVMGPRDIISSGVDGFLDEDLANAAINCLRLSRDDCRKKALNYSWDISVSIFVSHLVKM
jgi:glycosyltransferase involved in cell wall biosynthesis